MSIDREFCEFLRTMHTQGSAAARAQFIELGDQYVVLFKALHHKGHVAARTLFEEIVTERPYDRDQSLISGQPQDTTTSTNMPAWLPEDTTLLNVTMHGTRLALSENAQTSLVRDVKSDTGWRTIDTLLRMSNKDLCGLPGVGPRSVLQLDAYLLRELGVSRDSV
jgi:hypothetical protein